MHFQKRYSLARIWKIGKHSGKESARKMIRALIMWMPCIIISIPSERVPSGFQHLVRSQRKNWISSSASEMCLNLRTAGIWM